MALLAWYKLDGNANDSSGNGYNASSSGTVTYGAGKIGQTGIFNGVDSYLTCTYTPLSKEMSFSFSCWIKSSATLTTDVGIMSFGYMPIISMNTSGFVYGWWYTGTGYPTITSTTNCKDGKWHHIAFTRIGKEIRLFVDGVQEASNLNTTISIIHSNFEIGFEHNNGIKVFNGNIDDVRYYNHALSVKEIKELSKAKVVHYTFDDFQEPTVNMALNTDYSNRTYNTAYAAESWGGDAATVYYYSTGGYDNLPYKKLTKTAGGSGGSYIDEHGLFTLANSTTYTISVYMKASIPVTLNSYAYSVNRPADNAYITTGAPSLTTNWVRQVFTFTTSSTGAGDYVIRSIVYVDTELPIDIYWSGLQLEQKDHVTPYTKNSRGGIVRDISLYGNNITLSTASTPEWYSTNYKLGKACYKFNGTSQYFYRATLPSYIPAAGDYTQSLWFYVTSIPASRQVLIDDNNRWEHWIALQSNGTIYASYYNGGQIAVSSVGAISTNTWHHVVFSVKSGVLLRLYIDGVLAGENNSTGGVHSKIYDDLVIGCAGGDFPEKFSGYIEDVRIYATALSSDDVSELYGTRAQIDNAGNMSAIFHQEPQDLSVPVTKAIESQSYINGLSSYTQSNCQVTLTADGYRIYRPANLIYPDAGTTMWGGFVVSSLPEDCLTVGHTYKLKIKVKGKTSNASEQYFAYSVGWSSYGIALPIGPSVTSLLPSNFQVTDYTTLEGTYTIPSTRFSNGTWPCDITLNSNTVYYNASLSSSALRVTVNSYLLSNSYFPANTRVTESYTDRFVVSNTATSAGTNISLKTNTIYDTCCQIKIGFNYMSTGSLGTDIYIKSLEIIDITDTNSNGLISNTGVFLKDNISEVGVTDNIIGWWPLSGNAKDISGNANIGTVAGATIASGIDDVCYSFNGSSHYILVPYSSILTPSYVSLSVWAYATGWGSLSTGAIISKTESGGFGLRVNETAGYYGFSIYANGSYRTVQVLSNTLADGWHHFIGTFDGRYVKMYADSILVGTVDLSTFYPITYTYSNALVFGGEANSDNTAPTYQFFTGRIQDVRIYNRALTAEEVKILYDLKNPEQKMKLSKYTAYIKNEINEFL